MPVADYATYCRMLDNARNHGFAYPAINISSMVTVNATLRAFAEKRCDGIIQVSTGAGEFASGLNVADSAAGAIALAEYIHRAAASMTYLLLCTLITVSRRRLIVSSIL